MCGITGYWSASAIKGPERVIKKMTDAIVHRGPDSDGYWIDTDTNLVLGHRRLAIIDLSPAGHQPMSSNSGRYILTYNGEIYNHQQIRKLLDGHGARAWKGHSDTETLLAAVEEWGVEEALQNVNGMFAFALWDRLERKLYIARDRMGEKPLYYGVHNNAFLFSSELKALKQFPGWQPSIDRQAICQFLQYAYVPTPNCIYEGMYKLPPAHYAIISSNGMHVSDPICYWNIADKAERTQISQIPGSDTEALDLLDTLLTDAVGMRMAADVPLGAFLSGGYDSSMIVALMQKQSATPVRTFSVGFTEQSHNEAEHAKAVASHLGTEHTEIYVSSRDALNVIPQLPDIWDEPFADSSQIPTLLVSKLARQHVTVSLSGDGGDELFGGYNRYVQGYDMWRRISRLPINVRRLTAAAIRNTPPDMLKRLSSLLPERLRIANAAERLTKLADVLPLEDGESYYRTLVSQFNDPSSLVLHSSGGHTALLSGVDTDLREQMMLADMLHYLPDDILVKVDRASMAVSLESRVPLLDHRVVEFALSLPIHFKIRDGESKWLLRNLLYRYVPKSMMERPKMGFSVPIEHWLSGPLKEWASDLLSRDRIAAQGIFDANLIEKIWRDQLRGNGQLHHGIWNILMFQSWLDAQSAWSETFRIGPSTRY